MNNSSLEKKKWVSLLSRSLFYTSLMGFFSGTIFGYLHVKGWIPSATSSLILYSITIILGAVLSISFILASQWRHFQFKPKKIKTPPTSLYKELLPL